MGAGCCSMVQDHTSPLHQSPLDITNSTSIPSSSLTPELVHLCRVDLGLAEPMDLGQGPAGNRVIVDLTKMVFSGNRLNAILKGRAAADWLTIAAGVATIDVRATMQTDDGALIYVQYQGRTQISQGLGSSPIFVAPRFDTSDPRYTWLNPIQAIGKGDLKSLRYEWFELR